MLADFGVIIWTVLYLAVVFGLSAYGLHRYFIVYLFHRHKKDPMLPKEYFETLPKVTVQLPIFNELYVVERLLQCVSRLDYPRELLEIQMLDDSTDETQEVAKAEVEKLIKAGFNAKYMHRVDRTGFKAGALDQGLRVAEGEYIFILDADFLPTPDILKKIIHYFTDPGVGMIQTRWGHINVNYSILTRVQAMFLDGHLLLEQTARSRSGRFFNFNGTAGVWRKSCIIDAGGWEHDTLTEDLDLSYRAQLKGWRFKFLPFLVTPAELPVDMNGFKSQQHRWTKGSVQTCKKILPRIWASDFPFWIKAEATVHLTSNFAYLLLVAMCILIHPAFSPVDGGIWKTILLDIPIYISSSLSVVVFYWYCQKQLYPDKWYKQMILLPLLISLGIGLSISNAKAVLEAIFNHETPFNRTPKYGIVKDKKNWQGSLYLPSKSFIIVVELAFAAYFFWYSIYCAAMNMWVTFPFACLFLLGFGYVAGSSVSQYFNRGKREDSAPVEPEAIVAA